MIRILIVDDHPAMRAGLTAVLRAEPGFVPLDVATSDSDLWPMLNRTKPDIVVLDYHLPGDDGLVLCRAIKRRLPAPAVLLYSAYADAALTIPARLAVEPVEIGRRFDRMIKRLKVEIPAPCAAR
ncbi:MAG: response regulator transcription factor [Solirubrobacterales bacterium]|nr:response regulator transcription factor [Solirubrobacterales bacterium]